jgi:excisionase family DNA binding protein
MLDILKRSIASPYHIQTYIYQNIALIELNLRYAKLVEWVQNITLLLENNQGCEEQTRLYSLNEAARKLKIGYETLVRLIEEGRIGVIEIGNRMKIPHTELMRFLTEEARIYKPSSPSVAEYNELTEIKPILSNEEIFDQIKNNEEKL